MATQEIVEVQVVERIRETPRTISLVLQPLGKPLRYQAGQFLTLIFDQGELGPKAVRRSYSFSTTPGVDPQLTITIKKKSNGLVSRFLHSQVEVGDVLRALPPAGKFLLPKGEQPRDLFLIGGGSGITPLFSILKKALYSEPNTRVVLLYANRDEANIIYREPLRTLSKAYADRFHLIHLLSNPTDDLLSLRQKLSPAEVYWGRLSNQMVEKLVDDYQAHPLERAHFFLCGPKGLMLKATNALGYKGFAEDQVHTENFIIRKAKRPSKENFPLATVHLERRGESFDFTVKPGQTILEAAEQAGLYLPFSCRAGTCATCAGQCTRGEAVMYTQDGRIESKATKGLIFSCVAYPQSETIRIIME